MRLLRWITACVVLTVTPSGATRAETVTVYAAASLTDVLQELGKGFEEKTGDAVKFSLGSSSSLAKQIEKGAPADVFFSASAEWMDYLESHDLVEKGTRVELLGNALVIVALREEGFRVKPRKGFDFPAAFQGRLALADPSHVPAGIYARQALRWLGCWEALKDRIASALDVRAALAYVERGECAAGIVYATDAAISPKVEVIATLPEESHEKIVYPVAVMKDRNTEAVRRLVAFFQSKDAKKVFRKYGFIVLESSAPKP